MNDGSVVRCSHSAGQFSFSLLDELSVRLRRPRLREAPAGFGLEHLATTCMKNPGSRAVPCWDACFALSCRFLFVHLFDSF